MQVKPDITSSTEEHLMTINLQIPEEVLLLQQLKVFNMVTVQNLELREKCKTYVIIILHAKWRDLYLSPQLKDKFSLKVRRQISLLFSTDLSATNID